MPSITVTEVAKDTAGRVTVRFGSTEREFESVEHMRECVRAALTREDLMDLALALILARQPTLAAPAGGSGTTARTGSSLTLLSLVISKATSKLTPPLDRSWGRASSSVVKLYAAGSAEDVPVSA